MKFAMAMSVLALGLLSGCARTPADPFPASVGGWAKTGTVRTFDSATLPQYIDGDAERFLTKGFTKALTADYRQGEKTESVADVFVMTNADAARAIFENEPSAGSQAVAIGDSGRSYGQSVTFRQGRYFGRVVAYAEAPGLVELAKGIAAQLK
jgi:hypothetical protein